MTTNFSYNLLEQPWIPAMKDDGSIDLLGIKEVVQKSPDYLGISDPSPLLEYGIYRFLIAWITDAFDIKNLDTFENILEQENFDEGTIDQYSKKYYDNFDLFHPEKPFYQVLQGSNQEKKKSISGLFHNLPTGNNPVHFHHSIQDQHAISPENCAKALLTVPVFMSAAGSGYSPSINGIPPWYVLIRRKNLFESLLFNCALVDIPQNTGQGTVSWKRNDYSANKKKVVQSVSTTEGMTFLSRDVRLLPEKGGICTYSGKEAGILVRKMHFQMGLKFTGKWIDPHVAYVFGKKDNALKPRENLKIWQNIGPLALLTKNGYSRNKRSYERAAIITQFQNLKDDRIIKRDESLSIKIYGLRVDKAKNIEWQSEKLGIPMNVVYSGRKGIVIQEAMDITSSFNEVLRKSLYKIKALKNINMRNQISKKYWNLLEHAFKGEFILEIARADERNPDVLLEIKNDWKNRVHQLAVQILQEFISPVNTTATEIKQQLEAERTFNIEVDKMFK